MSSPSPESIINTTQQWLEKAVIGLNLCPFAKPVHEAGKIGYVVSSATHAEDLLLDLGDALEQLAQTSADDTETVLLIHPWVLTDFMAYNDFLDLADELVESMELDGLLQVASFHPDYQFDGTRPDDISNYSNRSPYPTLHLLRESSIDRAVANYPNTDRIYERNIENLQALGHDGWKRLWSKT